MAKLIQDLWILAESGVALYHRVFDKNLDPHIFGGLMTALNSFAEQLAKGGLSNFEFGDKRFSIIKKNNLLFIVNSSKKYKPKRVFQELEIIVEKFSKLYPKEFIANFSGDVKVFLDFEKEIEDSLDETIRKFQKSFW